jgi:hypothetical protein
VCLSCPVSGYYAKNSNVELHLFLKWMDLAKESSEVGDAPFTLDVVADCDHFTLGTQKMGGVLNEIFHKAAKFSTRQPR